MLVTSAGQYAAQTIIMNTTKKKLNLWPFPYEEKFTFKTL
jgi:hypothetical protein